MFNLNKINARFGSTHPLYDQHQYAELKQWFEGERKGILTGENNFDLLGYTLLFARDFVKEHPLSIVKCIDSRGETDFYGAISNFCSLLISHGITSLRQDFTLETLATIFKEADFHVLIICHNCSETVINFNDWHKFDRSLSKVFVAFLTTTIPKSKRYKHRSLPVVNNDEFLEYLRVPECEKADALQVIELCNRSLVELEIVNAFRREKNLDFKELKEGFSDDSIKVMLDKFRREWLQENCNDLISKLVSTVPSNVVS